MFGESRDRECHWFCDNLERVRNQQVMLLRTYIPCFLAVHKSYVRTRRKIEKRERRLMEIVLMGL